MQLCSRPQTGIRQVSKSFRLLYPLEDQLNGLIQKYVTTNNKIIKVQVFFDTDMTDDEYIRILGLQDGILQVETSLNWEVFSILNKKEQERIFINKLYKVVVEVAKKFKMDTNQIETAFSKLIEVNR